MQVTETLNEDLKREFKIVVTAGEIDAQLDARLLELAPQMNLPGFRPGKVPPALLRSRYGDQLLGEILDKTVNESTQSTLDERGLRPATQPKVEIVSFDKGKDLEYTVSVELFPEIETIDFSTLKLERQVAEIADDEVMEAVSRLAEQQKESEPVTKARAAKAGDIVVIDFIGRTDGEPFEGGTATDHHLELGSNSFIPGFEDQLIGAKVDDKKDVEVTFPDEYPAEALKGKQAVFEVTVKELREPKPVEIDDAFATRFGFENLDGLKDAMRERMQGEFKEASRAKLKRALLDELNDKHTFPVPPGMVEEEYRGIVHQVVAHGEKKDADEPDDGHHDHSGSPEEDEKLTEEERAEYREIAERRVRLGLLLAEVGRQNNIEVTDEEVTVKIQEQASQFPGQERFIFEYYQKNPQALGQIRAPLFEDKIVDFVVEMAEVTDKVVAPEQLFADEDADADGAAEDKPKKAAKKPAAKKASTKKAAAKDEGADAEAGAEKKKPAKKPAAKTTKAKAEKKD
jgi:trigger factor